MGNYSGSDCRNLRFCTHCVQKVNLFRNRVNVLRNRDNLFSTTSQIFPQAGEQLTPRSYTVTQLHSVIRFFDVWGWVKGLYL